MRPGIVSHGQSAEWIVEVPPASPHMPLFLADHVQRVHRRFTATRGVPRRGGITFDIRSASTPSNPYGTPLTRASIALLSVVVVEELDVDWF